MRTFNEREKKIIQRLLDAGSSNGMEVQTFVQSFWFGAQSSRALILQTQNRYAVFFLTPPLFDDEKKRSEEIRLFFEFIGLLHELHAEGYIIFYRTKTEGFYFLQETFNNEKVADHSIILNDKGDYTVTPDTIHDRNKKIIYKGIFFHADSFDLILNATTGTMLIHEGLNELLADKKIPLRKRIPAINLFISTFSFLIISLLAYLLYHPTPLVEEPSSFPPRDTVLRQQFYTSDSIPAKTTETTPVPNISPAAIYGVDISKWNGDAAEEIDPSDSISFIICKATEGTTLVDPDFDSNWEIIRNKKCILGAYHFYQSDDNPLEQATHYLSTVKANGTTDMVPIVDIEQGSLPASIPTEQGPLQKNFLLFLKAVEKTCHCIPMIYTNSGFANYYLQDTVFAHYPLWLAAYTKGDPPVPTAWKKKGYKIWQKKNSYQVETRVFDFDVFYGKKKDLYQ